MSKNQERGRERKEKKKNSNNVLWSAFAKGGNQSTGISRAERVVDPFMTAPTFFWDNMLGVSVNYLDLVFIIWI